MLYFEKLAHLLVLILLFYIYITFCFIFVYIDQIREFVLGKSFFQKEENLKRWLECTFLKKRFTLFILYILLISLFLVCIFFQYTFIFYFFIPIFWLTLFLFNNHSVFLESVVKRIVCFYIIPSYLALRGIFLGLIGFFGHLNVSTTGLISVGIFSLVEESLLNKVMLPLKAIVEEGQKQPLNFGAKFILPEAPSKLLKGRFSDMQPLVEKRVFSSEVGIQAAFDSWLIHNRVLAIDELPNVQKWLIDAKFRKVTSGFRLAVEELAELRNEKSFTIFAENVKASSITKGKLHPVSANIIGNDILNQRVFAAVSDKEVALAVSHFFQASIPLIPLDSEFAFKSAQHGAFDVNLLNDPCNEGSTHFVSKRGYSIIKDALEEAKTSSLYIFKPTEIIKLYRENLVLNEYLLTKNFVCVEIKRGASCDFELKLLGSEEKRLLEVKYFEFPGCEKEKNANLSQDYPGAVIGRYYQNSGEIKF